MHPRNRGVRQLAGGGMSKGVGQGRVWQRTLIVLKDVFSRRVIDFDPWFRACTIVRHEG